MERKFRREDTQSSNRRKEDLRGWHFGGSFRSPRIVGTGGISEVYKS